MDANFAYSLTLSNFCTEDEVKRILFPSNPRDILLRDRAEIITDNMRFFRVYRNKSNYYSDWSFENSFDKSHYTDFLQYLPIDMKELCHKIEFGDIFSNDVNGFASLDDSWGRFVFLNEGLNFFMKFINLAIMDFNNNIPDEIRINSLRIAIRIILKNEAMDFFMDPRGVVPADVGKRMHYPIHYELQYIAGHEFFHHLLGHFSDDKTKKRVFFNIDNRTYEKQIYNVSQMKEFEADINALAVPKYDEKKYMTMYYAALLWFLSLHLGELALDYVYPSTSLVKTHPSAIDRFNNIMENCKQPKHINLKSLKSIMERTHLLENFLLKDLSINFDSYEMYGSAYLDKPNTEWRGKKLVDRVDYY